MDLNITLLGQLITFSIFVWFTMRFVWPPILRVMQEREQRIASGLEAAEHNQRELARSREEIAQCLQKAQQQAAVIRQQAQQQADQIVEKAKSEARDKSKRIISKARKEVERELLEMRKQAASMYAEDVILLFEKIMPTHFNDVMQHALIHESIKDVSKQFNDKQ